MTEKSDGHPIERAVDKLVHAILDIRHCESSYLPLAKEKHLKDITECTKELASSSQIMPDSSGVDAAREIARLAKMLRVLRRLSLSKSSKILQESLYIYMFSSLDFFLGDLLESLFSQKAILFKSLDRTIRFQDLLISESVDDVKTKVLHQEIESIRRESYDSQFKWMENFFGIKLREWSGWGKFIEASQRRNLYVHCAGIVSNQYLEVCKQAGFKFKETPIVGRALEIDSEYFNSISELVMDAGVFLAHSLWRKVLPEQIVEADKSLNELVYDMLQAERWNDAARIAIFRIGQKTSSSDLSKKMATINLAIAKKFSGDDYVSIIDDVDWSSALPEFKMAIAVLRDDYKEAASIMRMIGGHGELVTEMYYHSWPLFKEFRLSKEFLECYEEIYHKPFKDTGEQVVNNEAKQIRLESKDISNA